jgi:hypothetical protein
MRKYVTPLLVVDEKTRWMSPASAYYKVIAGEEAAVQDETTAMVVLRRLGLSDEEIQFRMDVANGSQP